MISINTNIEGEIQVIEVVGEVDASSSIQLDTAISQAIVDEESKIIIDCSKLNYISSAGLGVFMSYIQDIENKGIKMVICCLNEKVESVFKILGLDQLLKIVETKNQATKIINEL